MLYWAPPCRNISLDERPTRANTEPNSMRLPLIRLCCDCKPAGEALNWITWHRWFQLAKKTIDWNKVISQGVAFAYIGQVFFIFIEHTIPFPLSLPMLPESTRPIFTFDTDLTDGCFSDNYIGATNVSIIQGAYHFAHPDVSSSVTQAEYFLAHSGKTHTLVTSTRPLTLPLRSLEPSISKVPSPISFLSGKKSSSHSKSSSSYPGNCSGLSASPMVAWIEKTTR